MTVQVGNRYEVSKLVEVVSAVMRLVSVVNVFDRREDTVEVLVTGCVLHLSGQRRQLCRLVKTGQTMMDVDRSLCVV